MCLFTKLDTEWYLSNVILFSQLFCDTVEKHRQRGEKRAIQTGENINFKVCFRGKKSDKQDK